MKLYENFSKSVETGKNVFTKTEGKINKTFIFILDRPFVIQHTYSRKFSTGHSPSVTFDIARNYVFHVFKTYSWLIHFNSMSTRLGLFYA